MDPESMIRGNEEPIMNGLLTIEPFYCKDKIFWSLNSLNSAKTF